MTAALKPLTPAGQPVIMTGGVPNGIPTVEFGQWLDFINKNVSAPNASFINVKDAPYGAAGDGATDDTAAIQAAINAAQAAGGGIVFFPAGTYKITTALSVTGLVSFLGTGYLTSILSPAVGINCLNISIPQNTGVFCRDFGIRYPSAATTGTFGISLSCSTGASFTASCLFDNLAIISADICLSVVNSQLYTIRACSFQQYSSAGIIAQNPVAPDGGDFSIDDNVFSTSSVTASFAIILRGVGGARIINNKIFASNGGIILQQPNATNSSLLMITGNSIEAMAGANPYGIVMQRLGTTGQFVNVTIIGNEFGITSGLSSCRAVYIPSDANGLWVSCLNISNNLMTCSMNSGSFNAMDIDSTSTFSITGNVGFFSGTALASMTMVVARAAADRAVVGPNIHSAGSGASTISSTNTTTITPT